MHEEGTRGRAGPGWAMPLPDRPCTSLHRSCTRTAAPEQGACNRAAAVRCRVTVAPQSSAALLPRTPPHPPAGLASSSSLSISPSSCAAGGSRLRPGADTRQALLRASIRAFAKPAMARICMKWHASVAPPRPASCRRQAKAGLGVVARMGHMGRNKITEGTPTGRLSTALSPTHLQRLLIFCQRILVILLGHTRNCGDNGSGGCAWMRVTCRHGWACLWEGRPTYAPCCIEVP